MTKCPICGIKYDNGIKFCPECGIKLEAEKVIPTYGASASDSSKNNSALNCEPDAPVSSEPVSSADREPESAAEAGKPRAGAENTATGNRESSAYVYAESAPPTGNADGAAPAYNPGAVVRTAPSSAPLSMWDYFLMEFVTKVPLVRLVMYFVWGFSKDTNENRKNWSRAQLIWAAVGLVFSFVGIVLAAVSGRLIYDMLRDVVNIF